MASCCPRGNMECFSSACPITQPSNKPGGRACSRRAEFRRGAYDPQGPQHRRRPPLGPPTPNVPRLFLCAAFPVAPTLAAMPNIPLEDNYTDILGKAMRGLKLSDTEVAQRSGVGVPELQTLREGDFSSAVAAKVAPVLGLNPAALAALAEKKYAPGEVSVEGLSQFNTPFEDMTVNAYLVWDPNTKEAAVFDTGSDASGILQEAQSRGLTIKHIFITHTHGDHIFDLDRLREKTGAKVWSGSKEPIPGTEIFDPGQSWKLGQL